MKGALHNHAGFHAHERQRTGTVAPVVRGFKINGDECGRVHVSGPEGIVREWQGQ